MGDWRGPLLLALAWALAGTGCDDAPDATRGADRALPADRGTDADPMEPGDAGPGDQGLPDQRLVDAAPDRGPDAGADTGPDLAVDAAPECPPCPGAQRCDPALGRCLEPAECGEDLDCHEGRHCLAGACTDDCAEDADCPAARICDRQTARCAEPAQCFDDPDCDPDRRCVAGACADACDAANPCPGQQVCRPDGRCQDAAVCEADADCAGERICAAGACVAACAEDADCPGTRRCDPVTGRCPEPAPCFVPEDCDGDRACVDAVCVGACRGDADCAGAQRCDAGQCVEPAGCAQDVDCRGARICQAEACVDPCLADADCPGATTCDPGTGRCSEPVECRRDRDCGEGQRCAAGRCQDLECEADADCPAACVDQRCADGPPVACLADADCARGQCAPVGICASPGPCAADADCPPAGPLCRGGACVTCQADADCAAAEFCQGARCVLFGACAADADCPGTRRCEAGACVPAGDCRGDVYDLPGRLPELALRTHTGLVACDGDLDGYRVALPAGAGLRVTARADAPPGDLSVWITGAGQEAVLARSDGLHPIEITGLFPAPAPRQLDVYVRARPGWDVPYSLSLEAIGPEDCLPDDGEGPFGNDVRALADPIGPEGRLLRLCPGDTDWLRFPVTGGVALRVVATPGLISDTLALRLEGPDGALLAEGAAEDRGLVAAATTQTGGTHALELRLAAGAPTPVDLQITATVTPATAAALCAAPEVLALGDTRWLRRGFEIDAHAAGCAPGLGAADRIYRLDLDRPRTVTVTVDPDDRQTALSWRSACAEVASESHCAQGDRLGPVPLPAGTHFLLVETGGFVPQRLMVTAED